MSGLDTRAIEVADLPHTSSPTVHHGFRVFISEEAFDRAVQRGNEEPDREVGGVLVGEVCKDDGGPYIRVDTTIDALHADEQSAELTFTHATWEHIHQEMDTKHQGKRILGWYHTHPGFGIFLSDRDLFIQKSFFNLPYQVALVYDPKRREHGVFVWSDNEPTRSRRHWVGDQEHIWDGAPPPQAPPTPAAERAEVESKAPPEEPDRLSLVLIAVVILAVGGLVGWWLGARSAADAVKEAQQRLDAARVAGAQQAVQTLNVELLALLRQSLGGEAVRRPLDESLADLERGDLERARQRIERLRDAHRAAEVALAALERNARRRGPGPREIEQQLELQQAVLGQICAEVAALAARGGDKGAARRLLRNAARVDPGKRELYERKLQEVER
ncbi:MAG: M67 family metallopeptidase [Planctomycetota bacterium]|jgi:proteasome lid subunit RPN8/RPN11